MLLSWQKQHKGAVLARKGAVLGVGTQIWVDGHGYVAAVAENIETLRAAFSRLGPPNVALDISLVRVVAVVDAEASYPAAMDDEGLNPGEIADRMEDWTDQACRVGGRMKSTTPNLPESAQRMVDVVGFEAALKVIDAWGGIRKNVPTERRVHPDSEIARLIGLEKARLFCRAFHGPSFKAPLCKEPLAVAMYRAGHSTSQVARAFRVHESTINKWVKKAKAQRSNDGTPDIFDNCLYES